MTLWVYTASPCALEDQPEKERERKRELTRGSQTMMRRGPKLYFSRELIYLKLYIENNGKNKIMQGQQPWPYRDQAFSQHTYLYTQVLGDLHHLLARRPLSILWPFSDKGPSTRKLICPKSVVLSKVWCHSQKALSKVAFLHSKDATIYNKEKIH